MILYTGCDCYKDLRLSQRKGDLQKWKIFDASLADALRKLKWDPNQPKVKCLYSGMSNVGIDVKKLKPIKIDTTDDSQSFEIHINIDDHFFGLPFQKLQTNTVYKWPTCYQLDTFTSFSTDKNVAYEFADNDGAS